MENISDKDNVTKELVALLKERGPIVLAENLASLMVDNAIIKEKLLFIEPIIKTPLINAVSENRQLSKDVILTADMALTVHDGFYNLEYDNKGIPYRWTGANGGMFCAYLRLDRSSEKVLVLSVLPVGHLFDNGMDSIICYIDGKQVKTSVEKESDSVKFIINLPPTTTENLTRVEFETPLWRPKELDPESSDGRELGVAFVSLKTL